MINQNQVIRRAFHDEAQQLTELSIRSKHYWNYPESYYDIWRSELAITPDYIQENDVFVFQTGDTVCGYYSRLLLEKEIVIDSCHVLTTGFWLEHLFILPDYIGRGFGTRLFRHMCALCDKENVNIFKILADPHSRGFYEKMGCVFEKEYPSTIEGRTIPLFVMDLVRPV